MGNSTGKQLAEAEQALLGHGVSWYDQWKRRNGGSDGQITFKVSNVKANDVRDGTEPATIHTVQYESTGGIPVAEHTECPLVVIHGYAWGVGTFYSSMPALAEQWPGEVYAIDNMGCGQSTRKAWTLGYGEESDLAEVEGYFVDALDEWRRRKNYQRITLCGHSVGGYLSVAFAEKYPEHVDRLILASPVGVPPVPDSMSDPKALAAAPWYFRLARSLWSKGHSPFAVVRNTPLVGKAILGRYCKNRFSDAEWTNADAKGFLHEYMYRNWCHSEISGGGYAHCTLLLPGAFARSPLCDRLPALYDKMPVSFIYGTRDWMTWTAATDVCATIEGGAQGGEQRERSNFDVVRVADAGHQLMVDNPLGFVEAVMTVGLAPRRTGLVGVERGTIVGYKPLALEAGVDVSSIHVGDVVSAEWSKEGVGKTEYYDASVVADNGDGSFKLAWMVEGEVGNEVTSHHPGHKMRPKKGEEDDGEGKEDSLSCGARE